MVVQENEVVAYDSRHNVPSTSILDSGRSSLAVMPTSSPWSTVIIHADLQSGKGNGILPANLDCSEDLENVKSSNKGIQ
jgi:hypothetical protein